ncbi:nitrate reductase molybdenum cofactor assembly chaperone [Actinomadura verrucosospora]|uniref:Respiratory nitrate reductase chaperone NarJ n=1 Tax=Actinomadura verrucosospora TaxID=46165 RepID=A0A7D4ANT1_ACTVE|nr:nitrate reductase molybdenum cofactor assembly chaperone [Actinomadura verrucosospora]QKG21429.1 respiratory nitrate reductase chaperone NarJ [Actinomadura verrucosospora]
MSGAPVRGAPVYQAASLLLTYPDPETWPERVDAVRTALSDPAVLHGSPTGCADALLRFCHEVEGVAPLELAARYVATFDRTRRRTLDLTYYTDGDTRRRGGSLARIKAVLHEHGWEPGGGRLPDFLPVLLEFAARRPDPGERLLCEHRPGLELLRHALDAYGSPYTGVLLAVRDALPGPGPTAADRAAVRELALGGPPAERVGLEPFTRPSRARGGVR